MAQVLSLLHTLTGDFDASFVGVAVPLCIALLEDVGPRRLIDKRLCEDHLYAVAAMQLVTARVRDDASAELSAKVRGLVHVGRVSFSQSLNVISHPCLPSLDCVRSRSMQPS